MDTPATGLINVFLGGLTWWIIESIKSTETSKRSEFTTVRCLHTSISYASVKWVSIGSGNGLSLLRRQAITWTNAGLLSIGPLGINFSEIWIIGIISFLFMKMYLKMSSVRIVAIWSSEKWVTSLMMTPECCRWTRLTSLLLMLWCFASPGHKGPWHWLHRIHGTLCTSMMDFNDLCHLSVAQC